MTAANPTATEMIAPHIGFDVGEIALDVLDSRLQLGDAWFERHAAGPAAPRSPPLHARRVHSPGQRSRAAAYFWQSGQKKVERPF